LIAPCLPQLLNRVLCLFTVPVEATAFLGAVAAFVVLLLVFFLYLNKKWCFYGIGGFPCCDVSLSPNPPRSKQLGKPLPQLYF
jgi:hypothetical protein